MHRRTVPFTLRSAYGTQCERGYRWTTGGRGGLTPLLTCACTHLQPGKQTWSSRDLSLGLETSRDPFLQVMVLVLVLKHLVAEDSI